MEPGLDPANSLVKDEAAMNVLRLESRVAGVVDYLARLKVAMSRIDTSLWPRTTLQNDLESLMTRLNEVPGRVAEWKKSSARCGADVALSLVRVHCQEAPSKLPIPGSTTFKTSWRLSLLLPLVLQTGSTWTSSSPLPVLYLRSEKLLSSTLNLPRNAEWIL